MTPYGTPAGRVRVLYRIASTAAIERTLEIRCAREPSVCVHAGSSGSGTCWTMDAWPDREEGVASKADGRSRFDLVVLHGTLDDLAAARADTTAFDAERFLIHVSALLSAGGVVAGCVQNAHSLMAVARRSARRFGVGTPAAADGHYSLRQLRSMLERAGFTAIHLFNLLPSGDRPLKLVDTAPTTSRLIYRHMVNASRLNFASFAFRRLAVEAGLYGRFMARAYFFWASKKC
jgi:hypothetical protein